MAHLISNIPFFKCWIRKEFTNGHQDYHGEYIHGLAIAVTTMPDRCLSFQIVFTGCKAVDDGSQENIHGGAMWARMPITALIGDIRTPKSGPTECQLTWRNLGIAPRTITQLYRSTAVNHLLGYVKLTETFVPPRYLFTVDYTESEVADDPANTNRVMLWC